MKKLRKILATISTVTLMSCVWGVNTQAEVKRNDLGVPTHIEAANRLEFIEDLKKVLGYIGSQLEAENQEKIDRIKKTYTTWEAMPENIPDQETDTYNHQSERKYKFVLSGERMPISMATAYLYQLLRKSAIENEKLNGVWLLSIKYNCPDKEVLLNDVVLQTPGEIPRYCICNCRWHMVDPAPAAVAPTEIGASFAVDVENIEFSSVKLGITNAEKISTKDTKDTAATYTASALHWMDDTAMIKLITVSKHQDEDYKTLLRYLDRSNSYIDFAKFKHEDAYTQALKPQPAAKK